MKRDPNLVRLRSLVHDSDGGARMRFYDEPLGVGAVIERA
jgi:hypothetical protein